MHIDPHPLRFAKTFWPDVTFYKEQCQIIESVRDNEETYVPAGNMLGKDFVAGFIALWYFMVHNPVRIITTSVNEEHLKVLWGEIDRFIRTSKVPLRHEQGGPLVYNHQELRKILDGELDKYSYLRGKVSEKGEGLSGHHARYTLMLFDEASGVPDIAYEMGLGWARRMLIIGNPNPCHNFFFKGVKAGDLKMDDGSAFHRKVIKIKAADNPNVRFGEAEKARGEEPTDTELVPGVVSYREYLKRRALWDPTRQCIGLDAEFPEDATVLLYPPDWLNRAEAIAATLNGRRRTAEAIGIDPAEGGDDTAMCAVDQFGIIDMVSKKTPDTTIIPGEAIAFMRAHGCPPEKVFFDAGGGGRDHACHLRKEGYNVNAIAFGGSPTPEKRRGLTLLETRKLEDEVRMVYKNRRAEMYWLLRQRLDPINEKGFAIPAKYKELRRQLSMIPLEYDGEGKLVLRPKNKPTKDSKVETLTQIIGRSPDDADALVLAVFGLQRKSARRMIRAIG